jgi:pectate lyase
LFFDDFEGTADKWVAQPPDGWSIVTDGTKAYKQGTLDTVARFAAAGNATWRDQVVEAKIKVLAFTGSSSSYQAAVYARFTPDAHYYAAIQSNGDFKIKKLSGGNNTSISSAATVDVAVNTWYTVKLEVVGTSLKAYLNGTAVLNATDADVTAGGVGVGTKNATAVFDDVRVTAP